MNERRSAGAAMLAERLRMLLAEEAPSPRRPRRRALRAGAAAADTGEPTPFPEYVAHVLARLRLLHDVPFRYLVADVRLLPAESIRFFTLDGAWLDALAAGALGVAGAGTRERARTRRALPAARLAAAAHQPFVRDVARGRMAVQALGVRNAEPAEEAEAPVSGFLLRSALVSGWPGLKVRAWASDAPADVPGAVDPGDLEKTRPELVVRILRLEPLSPSVLLALFDGIPRLVWLEEPHHGVQYGLEEAAQGWTIAVRDEQGTETGTTVAVPVRAGTVPGVVDVTALARAVDTARPLPQPRGSAALALQLLQAPSRQRFAATAAGPERDPRRRAR